MTVDVNTFAMADWFEAKIMQPVNGSVHRNPPSWAGESIKGSVVESEMTAKDLHSPTGKRSRRSYLVCLW